MWDDKKGLSSLFLGEDRMRKKDLTKWEFYWKGFCNILKKGELSPPPEIK